MGSQKRDVVGELGGNLGGFHLRGRVEPVASLRLKGRRATGAAGGDAVADEHAQPLCASRARGLHRHRDAAGLIRRASQACLELRAAVAVEDHVRVRVDPAGQDGSAAEVDRLLAGGSLRGGIGSLAYPGDDAVGDGEGGIGKRASGRDGAQFADFGKERGHINRAP